MPEGRERSGGEGGVGSVPAEPEEEGTDELERRGVALELLRVLPATEARAEDLGGHLVGRVVE